MVKGIDRFRDCFREFSDRYVLIGGAACDISFENYNADFRATKDLDSGQMFWEWLTISLHFLRSLAASK